MGTVRPQVGLLGLGSIGEHYCLHLLRAYPGLLVVDQDDEKVQGAVDAGASACDGPGSLGAACDFVVVSLPGPSAVTAALAGPDGLLRTARPGTIVIDTSTVSPQTNREMYGLATQNGVGYLDAPVSGGEPMQAGVNGAKAGTLTFMVGGDEEIFEQARPVLEVLGKHFFLLGPVGSGSTVKLISNLCSGIQLLIAAEAFALGAACGFPVELLIEVFQRTDARSYIMTDYLVPRVLRGDVEPGFTVDLQVKDHLLAEELGHERRVPLPFNALAIQTWERLRAQGRGQRDITDSTFFIGEQAGQELIPVRGGV